MVQGDCCLGTKPSKRQLSYPGIGLDEQPNSGFRLVSAIDQGRIKAG